jgi:hypothetical protein
VSYSTGGGGRWLAHMLGAIENNCTEFPVLNKCNFHTGLVTKYFILTHNDTGEPTDYTFGASCRFNLFLNSWMKFMVADNHKDFNNLTFTQQIYTLSNEARWRNESSLYAGSYESKIDLDYANIFLDPVLFRDQLLQIVKPHWPAAHVSKLSQNYVNSAIDAFKITAIDPMQHLGNRHSVGWLGWCNALCLLNNVTIPFSLVTHADDYYTWITDQQDWLIEKTRCYMV